MWRTIAVVVVLVYAVFTSPASARQGATNKPSRDWKQFSASGLDIIGNARDGDLRLAARRIAAFRETLSVLMPGLRLDGSEPTTLAVFRDHTSFTEFAPRDGRGRRQRGIGGYFLNSADRKYLVLPIFTDRRLTYEVVLHEYTHYIVSRNFRDVPRWLNEGLAEFYSTFDLDDEGRAIVGRMPSSRVWTLSTARMRPLRDLLRIDSGSGGFGSTEADLFYAQSWLFVHFMTLSDGGKRQGQIVKYLALLRETRSAEGAAREAFGTTLEALDREIARYIEGFQLRGIRITGVKSDVSDIETSPALAADVAELKARLLVEMNVPSEARKHVTRALELEPGHASGRITRARIASMEERYADAIGDLERVRQQEPQNFAAQFYLGRALYESGRYADAITTWNRSLKTRPQASAPWLQLSLAAMALGQYEQSDSAMAQLQDVDSSPSWHYARAYEALKVGRFDVVLPDVNMFIDRAGIADDSAPYAVFLGVIAAHRLDRTAEAAALLNRISPALIARSWAFTVARYLKGELPAAELLDKADDDGERTEARTYIAFMLIDAGQYDEARKHLLWVKEKGDRNYTEYELALAELKRLESSK